MLSEKKNFIYIYIYIVIVLSKLYYRVFSPSDNQPGVRWFLEVQEWRHCLVHSSIVSLPNTKTRFESKNVISCLISR